MAEILHAAEIFRLKIIRNLQSLSPEIGDDMLPSVSLMATYQHRPFVLLSCTASDECSEKNGINAVENFTSIDIMGSFIANDTFPATVELLEGGRLDLRNLVTHKFALKEIHAAIEAMRSGEAIKILVHP